MWPHIFDPFLGFHWEWREVSNISCQDTPCSFHGSLMHSLTLGCCRAIPKHYLEQPHMGRFPSESGTAAVPEHVTSGPRVTALPWRETGESFCEVQKKKRHLPLQSDALNSKFLVDKRMVTISPPTLPICRRKLMI